MLVGLPLLNVLFTQKLYKIKDIHSIYDLIRYREDAMLQPSSYRSSGAPGKHLSIEEQADETDGDNEDDGEDKDYSWILTSPIGTLDEKS